jgi:surfactin synthase thioesterase subunit
MPHAGGSAVFFRPWGERVTGAVEVHAAQYPGRADRMSDPFVSDGHRLARLIAGSMAPLMDRPAALFGHSMGAAVAYEVTRLLEERGTPPIHLFVSGAGAPHDRRERESVAQLDDDGVVEALVRLGGSDAELLRDPEMRELVLPYVRNDYALIEGYVHRPGPPLTTPVTVLIGDSDPEVDEASAAKWSELTTGESAVRVFPGDHFYLVPQQHQVIGEVLRTLNVPV